MANKLDQPKLLIQIEGKGKTRDMYNTESFSPKTIEWSDDIVVDDDWIQVFNESMTSSPVRKVIIESPYYNSQTELAWVTQVKTTFIDSASAVFPEGGTFVSEEHVEGICIKNYPALFGSIVSSVEIKVTSTVAKTISSRVYCWKDEV